MLMMSSSSVLSMKMTLVNCYIYWIVNPRNMGFEINDSETFIHKTDSYFFSIGQNNSSCQETLQVSQLYYPAKSQKSSGVVG